MFLVLLKIFDHTAQEAHSFHLKKMQTETCQYIWPCLGLSVAEGSSWLSLSQGLVSWIPLSAVRKECMLGCVQSSSCFLTAIRSCFPQL